MKNVIVRNTSQTAIYQQLFDQISSQIINGDMKPDEVLPSIRTIAKELRVSVITIKKTWELLEQNGFIYTVQGKGSYVRNNSQDRLFQKKIDTVKTILKDAILNSKEYDISKEELIHIVSELYDEKD